MDEAEPEKVYIKQESQKDILTDVVEDLELSTFCESPTKSNKSPTKSNESPTKDYEKVDTKYYSCSRCHDIIKGLINLANHFNRGNYLKGNVILTSDEEEYYFEIRCWKIFKMLYKVQLVNIHYKPAYNSSNSYI